MAGRRGYGHAAWVQYASRVGGERIGTRSLFRASVCVPGTPRRFAQDHLVGQPGACLFSKRLERGRFVWPAAKDGKVSVTAAQLSMLLEGIDWRMPQKTWRPLSTG